MKAFTSLKRLLPRIAAVGFLLLAMSASGCIPRYTLNGSSINYDIYKNINISSFPIRASLVYPPLQQTFENELLDYITRNTRLRVIDGGSNADLQMEGEITGYSPAAPCRHRPSAPTPTPPRPGSP